MFGRTARLQGCFTQYTLFFPSCVLSKKEIWHYWGERNHKNPTSSDCCFWNASLKITGLFSYFHPILFSSISY